MWDRMRDGIRMRDWRRRRRLYALLRCIYIYMTVICRLLMGGRRFRPSATVDGGASAGSAGGVKCSARAALSRRYIIQRRIVVVHTVPHSSLCPLCPRRSSGSAAFKHEVRRTRTVPGLCAPGGRLHTPLAARQHTHTPATPRRVVTVLSHRLPRAQRTHVTAPCHSRCTRARAATGPADIIISPS
jgi:hypothetical protein